MPTLKVNTDIKIGNSLWAPSSIAAFLLVSAAKMAIDNHKDQNIHLYIDGKEAAAFETNGRTEIALDAGAHTIHAKYQNLSTREYSFDMDEGEYAKKIFCVGNSNFRHKMNIVMLISGLYMFLFLIAICFFPKINLGLVFLPVIGILIYYIIAIKRQFVIDISEMWSEYV